MGDLRNKLPKLIEQDRRDEYARRCREGYTIFRQDFDPSQTRINLMLGETVYMMQALSRWKIKFYRAKTGGIGLCYDLPRRTSYLHDHGGIFATDEVSTTPDIIQAKRELCDYAVQAGMDDWRALPNAVFKRQVAALKRLYEAPVGVPAGEWLLLRKHVQPRILEQFDQHNDRLRENIYCVPKPLPDPTGPGWTRARRR